MFLLLFEDRRQIERSSTKHSLIVGSEEKATYLLATITKTIITHPTNPAESMYDYQSQTSLPPIRARQQRQSGVQVQQLYESSPVLTAISHHPSTTHYNSQKLQHADSSTVTNGNSSILNNNSNNGTSTITNGYHHNHHHHGSSQGAAGQQPGSEQSMRKSPSVDSVLSMRSSSQQRRLINALDPDAAMKTYMSKLTAYERHEIFSYPQIFFVGQNARKRQGVGGGPNNGKNSPCHPETSLVDWTKKNRFHLFFS